MPYGHTGVNVAMRFLYRRDSCARDFLKTLDLSKTLTARCHSACISIRQWQAGGRFREFLKKYGRVALGVHFSVSAVSITGLYVAINNNVDVKSLLHKVGMSGVSTKDEDQQLQPPSTEALDGFVTEERPSSENQPPTVQKNNRTAELAATSGGALALAVLCNKALSPITIALTPPIDRFLARRRILKNNV